MRVPGKILSPANITTYLNAIFDRKHTKHEISCRPINNKRYKELKNLQHSKGRIPWYFALNLHQNRDLLPQLMGSIVKVAKYLGPKNTALSIIEGNSPDGTFDVLEAMRPGLRKMGVYYHLESSDIDPNEENADRIGRLAALRNLALEPLINNHIHFSINSTVIFINDVAACPNDILELLLQRINLDAVMTCAMDWNYPGENPVFYDVWVARTLTGNPFFYIPADGSWDYAWDLFPYDTEAKKRYSQLRPFQVFSCWNGATAFSAQPILEGLRFRNATNGECHQGEPQLFGKDLWLRGYGKLAVVPSVNLEYGVENGKRIKSYKGYTEDNVANHDLEGDRFEWVTKPPSNVLCQHGWHNQYLQPWDYGFKNTQPEF